MIEKLQKQKIHHYIWGDNCDGWVFIDTDALSVKQEAMPPDTKEKRHYHRLSQQFFYILKGKATFYIEEEKIELCETEGLTILPHQKHFISNETDHSIEFLVVSHPSTNNDRINLE